LAAKFALKRYGNLLVCNALLAGPSGTHNVELLLDTGSNHSVAAVEVLEAIGCSPSTSPDRVRITTANDVIVVPRVVCNSLRVFDRVLSSTPVVGHDLPFAGPVQGLLGMDALMRLGARIDVVNATLGLD
jgi:predicted aspartyl protease